MPIPLIPIITALLAGGALVPHAAGGMIVTSAMGYVTGTYLSTVAITGIFSTIGSIVSAGALTAIAPSILARTAAGTLARTAVTGAATTGTVTTGTVTAAALGASAPALLSLTAGFLALGLGYRTYRFYELKRKVTQTPEGEEVVFTEKEAQLVEAAIKLLANKNQSSSNEPPPSLTSRIKQKTNIARHNLRRAFK